METISTLDVIYEVEKHDVNIEEIVGMMWKMV